MKINKTGFFYGFSPLIKNLSPANVSNKLRSVSGLYTDPHGRKSSLEKGNNVSCEQSSLPLMALPSPAALTHNGGGLTTRGGSMIETPLTTYLTRLV